MTIHDELTVATEAADKADAGECVRVLVTHDEARSLRARTHRLEVRPIVATPSPSDWQGVFANADDSTAAHAEQATIEADHAVRVITGPLRFLGLSLDSRSLLGDLGTPHLVPEFTIDPETFPENVIQFPEGDTYPVEPDTAVYCDRCGHRAQWRDGKWHHVERGQRHRADVPPVIGIGIDKGRCGRCNRKMVRRIDGKWHHKRPGQTHRAVVA